MRESLWKNTELQTQWLRAFFSNSPPPPPAPTAASHLPSYYICGLWPNLTITIPPQTIFLLG